MSNYDLENIDSKILSIRENIIKWYDFDIDSKILVIGEETKEIFDYLSNKLKNVCVYENINDVKVPEKFDYILLINCLSYKNSKNNENIINKTKGFLTSNGRLLLIVPNTLGLKFLSELEYNEYKMEGLTKKDLEDLLKKCNMSNYKFYYPMPSYKNVNVIFTDKCLPNQISLDRNIDLKKEIEIRNLNDRKILKEVVKYDKSAFQYLCNSYFVEVSNMGKNLVNAVYFNNIRKDEFRLITKVLDDRVYKCCDNKSSQKHLENLSKNVDILNEIGIKTLDSFDGEKLISKYVHNGITIQDEFLKYFNDENWKKIDEIVDKYKKEILYKLKITNDNLEDTAFEKYNITISKEKKEKLNFVKYGVFDLIFQNIFIIENEYYVYDQEWMEPNLPLEYILYRNILHMSQVNNEDKEKLYKYLNLNEYVDEFLDLEEKIQDKLLDKEVFNAYKNSVFSYKDIKTYIKELNDNKNAEIMSYKNQAEDLKEIIENKDKQLLNKLSQENKLRVEIERLKQEIELYKILVSEKEERLINKEKEIEDSVTYYENMKVVKLRHAAGHIYRKIKGVK